VKLTARSEYALLALAHLAGHGGNATVQTVAEAQEIPARFLEQILLTLKRAGYVRSSKGPGGGYRLARPADRISLAEVIRLIDGPLAPTESVSRYFYASTPIERAPRMLKVFQRIRDEVSEVLEGTTIADVS
jgi:Rrf2 family cysteine metabolism transcriptional repressor